MSHELPLLLKLSNCPVRCEVIFYSAVPYNVVDYEMGKVFVSLLFLPPHEQDSEDSHRKINNKASQGKYGYWLEAGLKY